MDKAFGEFIRVARSRYKAGLYNVQPFQGGATPLDSMTSQSFK